MLNGHLLSERYRIKETIGGGGMANVYLARDIILDRDVAIKVLRLEYANDEEFIARFDREAQSATSLSHPNVVNIYDVGEEEQILYMVMEYVDGMTLKEYIQRNGPIDVTEAIEIMKQITSAIAHAHENGIVHRDIKPQNILMDTYGNVKVTDFGIAVALSATSLTQTNSVLGSVHYLSPEQARGGLATKKSDIYSLGIVFFELLTGRLPFSGQSPVSIALKHLQSDTPSVRRFNPNVPQSVENIVLRATAKDPFHRYNTVYEMEQSLETALDPDKLDEDKFTPPEEVGEETKAIPIITDHQSLENTHQDTIIHHSNDDTKNAIEQAPKPSSKSRNKKIWITFIVFFVLIASGIAALFIIPGMMKPNEVQVPNVIEWEYEEALEELDTLNLRAVREESHHDEIEEGFIIKTEPRGGRTVLEDSEVTLYVSLGEEGETFGNYEGRDINQVRSFLTDLGYSHIEVEEEYSSEYQEGQIIRQIHPVPNSEVIPSETRIIFEVSKGPEPVELIRLKGSTEEEAREYLEREGLNINVEREYSDEITEGQVIRQQPEPGEVVEKNSTVTVYISNGPEELPLVPVSVPLTVEYQEQEDNFFNRGPQEVLIYVDDANRNMDIPAYEPKYLSREDQLVEFTINLIIAPDTEASYRVTVDGETVIEESISYEEVGD